MDIETIKAQMRDGNFVVSAHADQEAADEGLDIAEIRDAILGGEILESYENTGRGPSCLILGFVKDTPIHVVCGWRRHRWLSSPHISRNHPSLRILGHEGSHRERDTLPYLREY